MESHMKLRRPRGLPERLRDELVKGRRERGWTQAELGRRMGLPQMHISGIETGKIVPRYDTMLELVRVLDRDLVLIPRRLSPAVLALIRDPDQGEEGEQPLYTGDDAFESE